MTPESPAGPSVLVSVGTDHHPFDRLVDWLERWSRQNPQAEVWVQRGTSRTPVGMASEPLLPHEALRQRMATADCVVVQGGPGGIIDSLRVGRRPVVVPRRADLGEHVDNHQVAFARHLAAQGEVELAEQEPELHRLLDEVSRDRTRFHVTPYRERGSQTAEKVAAEVRRLVARSR